MKRKVYTLVYTIGGLIVLIGGGFVYSYYPSKFIRQGYSIYEAKQKTYIIMVILGIASVVLYYIIRFLGINEWYIIKSKKEKQKETDGLDCECTSLMELEKFGGYSHYEITLKSMMKNVDNGFFKIISQNQFEVTFICNKCKQIWKLGIPDYPVQGYLLKSRHV